ncbi:MAG: SMI1/KNR4 family protein [Planctomycetaceae bacterium]|nr:SMI1/KNR4 family protein [Planctomycetaceae bacterium]
MAIRELIAIVPPPESPSGSVEDKTWDHLERELGVRLPDDLRDFAVLYGSGRFYGTGIQVYNPFSTYYVATVTDMCDVFRTLKQYEGDEYVPFNIYPELPGIFPWGGDNNGNMMFWLTEGLPDEWPTLLWLRHDGNFYRYETSMTASLAGVFSRQIEWYYNLTTPVRFEPEP